METEFGHYYDHFADGLKLISLAYAFYVIYYPNIDNINNNLIHIIFLLFTIHFSIKNQLYVLEGKKVHKSLILWVKLGSLFGKKERLKKIIKYTRYFDESASILYITLIISCLHYRMFLKKENVLATLRQIVK